MATVFAELCGRSFRFFTAPGLFSADRVDDGTRLLLEHLPGRVPSSVLDLGCGYGALGLPVAALHPRARVTLVDRDVLAVEYSIQNATSNELSNVVARPSLGLRDVVPGRFDWVLANVPARIGEEGVAYFLTAGAARLEGGGELRVVVIRALLPAVERVARERGLPVRLVAHSERHAVFACPPAGPAPVDHDSFYRRDRVRLLGREFERPFDINEDEPHLATGVPLLVDCLPRRCQRALTWRGGYGPLPCALAGRGAAVTASDRDLLALAFVRRNAGDRVGLAARAHLSGEQVELVTGELWASAGPEALSEELLRSQQMLARGGQALWLVLAKTAEELAPAMAQARGTVIARRGAYVVVRAPARAG